MLFDVITPFTTAAEWPAIRSRIRTAFFESMGTAPESGGEDVQAVETSRETQGGLTRIEFRYQVIGDYWTDAVLVAPAGSDDANAAARPIVLALHGTNRTHGKYSMVDLDTARNRSYALELAERGLIGIAPDQFGFGPDAREIGQDALFERFYSDFPEWSLDGMRLTSHIRLIDLLGTEGVLGGTLGARPSLAVGAIGNSLGGRAVINLAAVDERVAAAVVSTGISPNYSNVYRHMKRPGQIKSPRLTDKLATDGIAPWDYQHLISLCAPRSVLIIEPWFDPYNPDTPGAMSCAAKAAEVYRLVGRPEGLRLLVHGDGHDTSDATRGYAYDFLAAGLA